MKAGLRALAVATSLLLIGASFKPGRLTHLSYDTGPYRGFVLDQQGVTLEGDGVIGEDVGIAYPVAPDGSTGDSTAVYLRAAHATLRDLVISYPLVNNSWGQQRGGGDGIRFDGETSDGWRTIWATVLDHVNVLYPGRNCLRIDPGIGAKGHGYWVSPTVRDCNFYGSLTDGVVVNHMTDASWERVTSTVHKGWGFVMNDVQTSKFKLCAENVNGGFWLTKGEGCQFEALHFEEFSGDSMRPGLLLENCVGVTVSSGSFANWSKPGAISIKLVNCRDCVVMPCFHAAVQTCVYVDSASRGNTVWAQPQYNFGAPTVRGKIVADRRKNRVIE
jgi:hypothetical protein